MRLAAYLTITLAAGTFATVLAAKITELYQHVQAVLP